MATATVDLSEIEAFRKQLEALPAQLQSVAQGIVADEAKQMAVGARQAYRETYRTGKGNLGAGVTVQQRGPLAWRVFNADAKAHWFEYVPGTDVRSVDTGARRGQIRVQSQGEAIGGFSGVKGTPDTRSSAVFRPIFIPLAIRHRRRMLGRLVELVRSQGFTITGYANPGRAA